LTGRREEMPSLKILVVNWLDRLNPEAGGAETHLHEIFGRVAAGGHEVSLLSSGYPKAAPREELDGISVYRIGSRMTFGFGVPRFVRKVLNPQSFDVVVEDLNKVPLFMPLWTPAPVVLLVHHLFGGIAFQSASGPVAAATWVLERTVPWVYRNLPAMAVSPSTVEDLRRRGLTGQEIAVVPNGVDLDRYSPAEVEVRSSEPTLLYLGRLKKYKRVDLIIRAVDRLRQDGIAVKLLIVGKGDSEESLKELHRSLNLGKAVEFLGYVEEAEKVRLLRQSWVHVLTSPKEGWGISILEAAACGTPSVASDSPGLRDSVRDGVTGRLVPHGDVEALAGVLRELIQSSSFRREMGTAARTFAEGFTWDDSAKRTQEFLQDRVAGKSLQG
jgi:glycosyltransferase involved in cell wall biosynthesis